MYGKYHLYKKQLSWDSGTTWYDSDPLVTVISGTPVATYETYAECAGIQYIWTESGTTCIGYDKYKNNIKQQSTDGGTTWTNVIPEEYSASTLIEVDSPDCGYVPTFNGKFQLLLNDSSVVSAECDSSSNVITSEEISAQYSGTVVSAEIGDCVTSIGDKAFENCASLTSCTIGSGVTSIGGWNTFYNCSSLTSINIPDSVATVGLQVFGACRSLTSVTIGSGVTSIEAYAFSNCSGLTSITIEATTPPTLKNKNAFGNTNNCPIYVPSGSVNAYKSADVWYNYTSRIQAIP